MTENNVENMNVENDEPQFIPLRDFENDYEIQTEYPFTIRRKSDKYIISEWFRNGYLAVTLNGNKYNKHVLIAKQFIENPNNLPFIDHINHNRSDNHLSNLRWVTASQNQFNKSSHKGIQYEFVSTIPEDSIQVTNYGNHIFTNNEYFYYDNLFYFFNGIEYRILHINEDKFGNKFVIMRDDINKHVNLYYSKFKRLYDIPFD